MAEENKAAVEEVNPEDLIAEEVFPPEEDDDDIDEDPPEETEAAAEDKAAETTAAATFTHSPELIEKAVNALYTTEEIAGMSPEALRVAIMGAHRVGQAVFESNKKPSETPAKTDSDSSYLDVFDDPEKVHPDVGKPLKQAFIEFDKRLKARDAEIAELKKSHTQTHQQTLHTQLTADLEPEVAKVFDLDTSAGKAKYAELLEIMGAVQRKNTTMPQKQLRARAMKAMDIVPEKPKETAETKKRKEDWNDGSLAEPTKRKTDETAEEAVRAILRKRRNQDRQSRVNGRAN